MRKLTPIIQLTLLLFLLGCARSEAAPLSLPQAMPQSQAAAGPVEVRGEWTATSRKWVDGDRHILDISIGRINYKAPWKGVDEWTEIDEHWEIGVAPWDWESAGIDYTVRVKEDITAGQPLQWEFDGDSVFLTFNNLQWTNDLGQIELISIPQGSAVFERSPDNRSVKWIGAYGAGIDLEWELQSERLMKKLRLLSQLSEPSQYIIDGGNPKVEINFIFTRTAGLDLWVDGVLWDERQNNPRTTVNAVEFRNAAGEVRFEFAPPRAWSEIVPDDAVHMTMLLKRQGPNIFLSVRTPKSWLDSAEYPVVIDATLILQVGTGVDDAREADDGANFSHSSSLLSSSSNTDASIRWNSGMRFTGVTIRGTIIGVAYLTIVPFNTSGDDPNVDIHAEDVDNAVDFSTNADVTSRVRTGASEPWIDIEIGVGSVNSPSIVSVLQELADRGTFADVAAVLFFDGKADVNRSFNPVSFNYSTSNAPKLHIEYTAAGAERRVIVTS